MREMRGEEARGGRGGGGGRRGRCCTLMPSAPNGGMKPRWNARDASQTGKSPDVCRRWSHRRWAASLMMVMMMLQVLHVDQTVLVLLLDVLRFRTPGPALVRAASRRLRAKFWMAKRGRRYFWGRGTGYHFRRGSTFRLDYVVDGSGAGCRRFQPVHLDLREPGQHPCV